MSEKPFNFLAYLYKLFVWAVLLGLVYIGLKQNGC